MTDIVLSSFLSLFALFGKEEQVDEAWARTMLTNYLRHHFGIRNIDLYLDLYSDMRMAYEMTDEIDMADTVRTICSNLHGKISVKEESLLLLRLMEFCGVAEGQSFQMFETMAEVFHIQEALFKDYTDYVADKETKHVMLHKLDDTDGMLNGGSMLIGSDSYALYFKGDYTSWDRTKREDFYYGITLDGQRVLIFTEKK